MKFLSVLLAVFLLCAFPLVAQTADSTELSFLDGFTISVEDGYSLSEDEYVWVQSQRRELSTFTVTTPADYEILGTVLYDVGVPRENLKDDLFPMIRYIYREYADFEAREMVALLPDVGELPFFYFYYALDDMEFTGYVVLLDESPGSATACFFSMMETGLPIEGQESIIDDLIEALHFEFDDAAG